MQHADKKQVFQTGELPQLPYDAPQIRDFLSSRTGNQSTRIRVFFERDHTTPEPAFRIGYGDKIKGPDHPSFFAFDRAEILDPQQRPRITNDMKRTAVQLAGHIKADASPYAHESKRLFQQIADNPYRLYTRLQDHVKEASWRLWDKLVAHDHVNLDKLVTKFQSLPLWMQIMMVESDTVYRYGYSRLSAQGCNIKQNGLIGLYNKVAGIAGQFNPFHGDFWSGPCDEESRWVDAVDIAKYTGWGTLFHEEGHKLSAYFGRFAGLDDEEPWRASDLPDWKEAVKRTQSKTTWGNVGLKLHLLFYPEEAHAEESLAEMTRLYVQSYIANGGDDESIDRELTRKLPDLWPVFHNRLIPDYTLMARERYQSATLLQQGAESGQRRQTATP